MCYVQNVTHSNAIGNVIVTSSQMRRLRSIKSLQFSDIKPLMPVAATEKEYLKGKRQLTRLESPKVMTSNEEFVRIYSSSSSTHHA